MVSKAEEDVVVDDGIFLLWGKNDGLRAAVTTTLWLLVLKSADVVPDRAAREKMIGYNLTMVNGFFVVVAAAFGAAFGCCYPIAINLFFDI